MPTIRKIRLVGAEAAISKANRINTRAMENLRRAAHARANRMADHMRTEIRTEYQFGKGELARSIQYKTTQTRSGFTVSLYAYGRVLSYITDIGGGSFHGAPYPIIAKFKKRLFFYWHRMGRFAGPERVIHPGFRRDVIREVGESEGAAFVADMNQAVSKAIAEMNT